MPRRSIELACITAIALVLTAIIAAPVLRAPSERLFGYETVGRHHDPFTVMRQFEHPQALGVYAQPVTDLTGALIARLTGAVAAYNWLVLFSLPLAAMASYLLARHLGLSFTGATLAALAFAFSPFHLAHAAYHPHIAQVHWVPLYFLALWRALDTAAPARIAMLLLAAACVTFSNFYGGLIAAVTTPFVIGAYWMTRTRGTAGATRHLAITSGTLVFAALAGLLFVWATMPVLMKDPSAFAVLPSDPFNYSAKWWSYIVPPVANPWLGRFATSVWETARVRDGLLEQQVTIGTGVILLGLFGVAAWRGRRRAASAWAVPMLAFVAIVAFAWSLSPAATIAGATVARPSALIVALLPMFRSFARFAVVVQLMAALLAAFGAEALWRKGRAARVVCVTLVLIVAGEYAVRPASMWRDVLPTSAHRWLMEQPGRVRALDCTALTQESASVQWLTEDRVILSAGTFSDCLEPRLVERLAAAGYTHLIVRAGSADNQWLLGHVPEELLRVRETPAATVLAVMAMTPAIYTEALSGFSRREINDNWTWRWMSGAASWTINNTRAYSVTTTLDLELAALHRTRDVQLSLDGQHVGTLSVAPGRARYATTPITVPPGRHTLEFRPAQPPDVADALLHNGDRRQLSFALGDWRWTVRRDQP